MDTTIPQLEGPVRSAVKGSRPIPTRHLAVFAAQDISILRQGVSAWHVPLAISPRATPHGAKIVQPDITVPTREGRAWSVHLENRSAIISQPVKSVDPGITTPQLEEFVRFALQAGRQAGTG